MKNELVGSFCLSKAGHDKGFIYIIVDQKDDKVLVADGKIKKSESPKVKNIKHLAVLDYRDNIINEKIKNKNLSDVEIKYAIKIFKNSHNNEKLGGI